MFADLLEMTVRVVFHASWQAALLAIVVVVTCRALPRIPATLRSCLWLIVLVRFLLPITPQSPFSLFNLACLARSDAASDVAVRGAANPEHSTISSPSNETTNHFSTRQPIAVASERSGETIDPPPETFQNTTEKAGKGPGLVAIVGFVWVLGFAVLLVRDVLLWLRLRAFLSNCRPANDRGALAILERCSGEVRLRRNVELVVTHSNLAPAVSGAAFPRIIVSAKTLSALSSTELTWLFRHELAHVCRWDLAVQRLWSCASALHWFNPVVWWAASRARTEAELACDERALRSFARSEQLAYGQTLLKVAELLAAPSSLPAVVGVSLGEPVLSRRIRAIAGYRRSSRATTLVFGSVLIGVAGAGLSDAIEYSATPQPQPVEQSSDTTLSNGRNAAPGPSASSPFDLPVAHDGRPKLAAVLGAWEAGLGRLQSYDVYLRFDIENYGNRGPVGPPPLREPKFWQKFSHDLRANGKLRVEEGVAEPGKRPQGHISVWDGELAKQYLPEVRQFHVGGRQARFAADGASYDYYRSSCANGSDMIQVLRMRPGTVVESADSRAVVVYTPAPLPFGYRVWLDPAKGFLPSKIDRLLDVEETVVVDLEDEYTLDEVCPGVWAPVKIVECQYPKTNELLAGKGRLVTRATILVDRNNSRFNVPIDAALFQLPVPQGFWVSDDICHRTYEFGKANTSLTQISQWVLEGKMSAKDYKAFVKRSGVADKPVQGEVRFN
jgi:beta-lactamase regulating signal transducer with metallopeptidase domain